jgi:hypothetical protein
MKIIQTGNKDWTNRHEVFTENIKDLYITGNEPNLNALDSYNDATKSFQKIINDAIQTNTPLRSLGAGWSWSKIATVKDGIMMDTKPLNTTMNLSSQSILPAYTGDIKKLIFAQCGNGVWELSAALLPQELSLKTSGASNGQTIVGAMSTGAHGSSIDVGAVPDYVIGMHIITGPDRHVWLERKSTPVVSASFINKLQTELIQDDDLFNAALVSFGNFGIIHGVLLEVEDLFLLETYMRRMPYDDTLKNMMETLDFSNATLPCGNERPFHFEVRINPYDLSNGAYVASFYKRAYRPNYQKPVVNDAGIGPGDDAPCFIGAITNAIPELVPLVVNKLLAGALTLFEKQMGTLAEIFNNTTLHGKLYSAAIGLPLDQVNKVTDILFEINKTPAGPFAGLFAFRFIKKTKAMLGFTRFDFTCILELDGAFSDTTMNFYQAVWQRLDDEKIPYTVHWGKINELNFDRISSMYGNDADNWIVARNKLLDAAGMKVFTNPLLQQWGLDKVL